MFPRNRRPVPSHSASRVYSTTDVNVARKMKCDKLAENPNKSENGGKRPVDFHFVHININVIYVKYCI